MDELPPIELKELKSRIITGDIKQYSDYNALLKYCLTLKSESDESVSQFKDVISMLTDELARVTGDPMLNMHKNDIITFVNSNTKKIVDGFILKCYNKNAGQMRSKILIGDDSFFMNNSLDEISEGDGDIVNIIFQFKKFWGKLSEDNKLIIKSTLTALIALCDVRFVAFNRYMLVKDLNKMFSANLKDLDKVF